MKRFSVFMICAALLAAGCSQSSRFSVKGDLASAGFDTTDTDSVMIYRQNVEKPLKAAVKDGSFTLTGKVDKPQVARLRGNGRESRIGLDLFLESGTITFKDGQAVGTPLNDAVAAFYARIKSLRAQYADDRSALRKAVSDEVEQYVLAHLDDPTGAYVFRKYQRDLSFKVIRELNEKIPAEFKEEDPRKFAPARERRTKPQQAE